MLQATSCTRTFRRAVPAVPDDRIDERIAHRQRRQAVIDRKHPPTFRFFLDEHVLNYTGPGTHVRSNQPHYLLRMTVRPNVEIRIVPKPPACAAAAHRSSRSSPHNRPMVYLEGHSSAITLATQGRPPGHDRELITRLRHFRRTESGMRAVRTVLTQDSPHPDARELRLALRLALGVESSRTTTP